MRVRVKGKEDDTFKLLDAWNHTRRRSPSWQRRTRPMQRPNSSVLTLHSLCTVCPATLERTLLSYSRRTNQFRFKFLEQTQCSIHWILNSRIEIGLKGGRTTTPAALFIAFLGKNFRPTCKCSQSIAPLFVRLHLFNTDTVKYLSNYYIPIPVYVKGYGHFMQTRGGSPPRPPHLSSYM